MLLNFEKTLEREQDNGFQQNNDLLTKVIDVGKKELFDVVSKISLKNKTIRSTINK